MFSFEPCNLILLNNLILVKKKYKDAGDHLM